MRKLVAQVGASLYFHVCSVNLFTDQDARWRVDFVGDVAIVKHRMAEMISTLACRTWASRAMRVAQVFEILSLLSSGA
eukprot:5152240-Pyramimonas_sp.AAC.1